MKPLAPIAFLLLALVASAGSAQHLIAFHGGEYCEPCKRMAPIIKSIEADGFRVEHVDVEQGREMAQLYRVQVVPTFVVVGQGGKESGRLTGMQTKQSIMRLLGNAPTKWQSASQSTAIDEPEWREYNPPGAVDDKGLLESVLSRLSPEERQRMQARFSGDLATMCHEATHLLDARIANSMGPSYCAFFIGGPKGRCIVLREPRISTSTITQYVPANYRDGLYFTTYLINLPRQPGYPTSQVIDEWNAACNGWQASKELSVSDSGDARMAQHFVPFADAFLTAVQRHDPSYPDLDQLAKFVAWQKREVGRLSGQVEVQQIAGSHGGNGGYFQSETIQRPSQPTGPQPTQPVSPQTNEKIKQEWLAYITNTVNTTVTNKLEGKECKCQGCMTKADVEAAIVTAISQIQIPPAYSPPTPEQQAAAIAPYLKHSAQITLPDGKAKLQTKPLSDPLEFIQHSAVVK